MSIHGASYDNSESTEERCWGISQISQSQTAVILQACGRTCWQNRKDSESTDNRKGSHASWQRSEGWGELTTERTLCRERRCLVTEGDKTVGRTASYSRIRNQHVCGRWRSKVLQALKQDEEIVNVSLHRTVVTARFISVWRNTCDCQLIRKKAQLAQFHSLQSRITGTGALRL